MKMKSTSNQALLLVALSFTSSLFCNTADIFREMLPMSTPVEAQEEEKIQGEIPRDCKWEAVLDCPAQVRAWILASQEDQSSEVVQAKFLAAQNCVWNSPCARKFKRPAHVS